MVVLFFPGIEKIEKLHPCICPRFFGRLKQMPWRSFRNSLYPAEFNQAFITTQNTGPVQDQILVVNR